MAEIEFHELHGDYVANAGQTINLREYLDYFEPLGSALSRLPDGTGGPFVHRFTDSGGRTIGSIGWVVSAASKRFGAWTLWGMWTDRAIPAVALPLFWSALADPSRTAELVRRANKDAERLVVPARWPDLLDEVKTLPLRDDALRESLRTELERAWAVPPPHQHSLEVELTPRTLDLLPFLYILGPVDPVAAQIQPSRFNGAGYQYILDEHHAPAPSGAALAFDVEELVDTAASDVVAGWRMASELRARRNRPKTAKQPLPRTQPAETNEMPKTTRKPPITPAWRSLVNDADAIWKPLYSIAMLALVAWIAFNVNLIRKATTAETPAAAVVSATAEPQPSPVPEDDVLPTRIPRLAAALSTQPLRGIRVGEAVLTDITQGGADADDKLGRVAIEIFLRRNACFPRTEAADGRFSTAEQRAIRTCAVLQNERLMSGLQPDTARALDWLERVLSPAS
jgi:hypothetical protein